MYFLAQNKRYLPHENSTKVNSVKLYRQTKRGLFASDTTSHKHPSYAGIGSMRVQKNLCRKSHTDRILRIRMSTQSESLICIYNYVQNKKGRQRRPS